MKNRVLLAVLVLIGCMILGVFFGIYKSNYYQTGVTTGPGIPGLLWPNPKLIGSFQVVDQRGHPFGQQQLTGKWSFLFFGYTHCPDVCPVTLSVMNQAHAKLAAQNAADNVQMIFASVDTKRDTPEQMASFVGYFNKDFIGLTGSEEQIASFTRQIGIVYALGEETAPGEYLVDHSASVFLVSPAGQMLAIFSAPQQADDMVARFIAIRDFVAGQNN